MTSTGSRVSIAALNSPIYSAAVDGAVILQPGNNANIAAGSQPCCGP